MWWHTSVTLVLGLGAGQRQTYLWDSLASQPARLVSSSSVRDPVFKRLKKE